MISLQDVGNFSKLLWKIGRGQEFGFSFNVADRCPIGCDCYWRAQARVNELSDDEVVEFFYQMKKRGYLLVTLVGGEPYVRPELLEKITPIIPANWLVTSGTTPLRMFPKTTHSYRLMAQMLKHTMLFEKALVSITGLLRILVELELLGKVSRYISIQF